MMHAQNENHIDGEDRKGVENEIQMCLPLKKRYPTCARCRNHGLILDVKGHKRTCEYRECRCSRCNLVSQRRVVMAKQVALSREQVKQHRRNRHPSDQQLLENQEVFQDTPGHPQPPPPPNPEVIGLTSEKPVMEELPYPVVQPSPDSTNTCINIGYSNSPYSPWEFSREDISQMTQITSSPLTDLGQAPHSYPSLNSSQIHADDTYRSRMAFTSNRLSRPIIPSPAVPCYQPNDPMVRLTYRPNQTTGATPLINMPSLQENMGVTSQIYPSPWPSQVDGTYRSRGSFPENHMVQPRPMLPNQAMDTLSGYHPYQLLTPSVNLSSSHSAVGGRSQCYPTTFQSSQVDASYRCHVSMTANNTFRPVLPTPMVQEQSSGAVSAYCGNCPEAYSYCNSTVADSFHARDAMQSMCHCNITDRGHWHSQVPSYVNSSGIAPFEERAASTPAYPPSIMTTKRNFVYQYQHPVASVTPIPYAFQTPDESLRYSHNVNADKENGSSLWSQTAATSHQSQIMTSVQSDSSAVRRPQVVTTSQRSQGMFLVQPDYTNSVRRVQAATATQQSQGNPSVQSDYFSSRRPQLATKCQGLKGTPLVLSDYIAVLPQVATSSQQPQHMPPVQSVFSPVGRSQEATTFRQPKGIPPVKSDNSSVRPERVTTSPKPRDDSSVHSDEPSYRSRRPFPLRITIPSLQLNQSNCSDTPIDSSPTFSPSTLSLMTNVTLPTSDIPSPGFFASSLPTFNYPSPTLPTQSSPVFSYPSPFTNPPLHAGAHSFQDLVDSQLPTSHSMSNLSEQIRIPPKYDEDLDGDQEGSEIDVCSLDQYGCQ